MAEITASAIKALRDKTGAGMMDSKKALVENSGDMDAAVDWLRAKGLAKAAKKADRVAAEGLVAAKVASHNGGERGVAIELNSETDFVARNDKFQALVRDIAGVAADVGGDLDTISNADFPGAGKSVGDHLAEMVGTIGENMQLRRSAEIAVSKGAVAAYIHGAAGDGLGRIGVLVGLESDGDAEKLRALGRQIAMHVAAARPLSARVEDLDPKVVERERGVFAEQARQSGKPENIIEKMIEGRLRKFYEEAVLLEQVFVVDGETKVAQVLKNAEQDVGAPVKLAGFARLELGEGVEKAEDDFAAEVQAAAGLQPTNA